MTGTDLALIIAAAFWGLLVIGLCFVLVAVVRLVDETAKLVHGITDQTVPLIGGLGDTVAGVNVELARVDTIVAGVQSITTTTDHLVAVVHTTVATPLIKAVAYTRAAGVVVRKLKG